MNGRILLLAMCMAGGAVAEPLTVTCRLVRPDGSRETRTCPLVRTGDTAVLKIGAAEVGEARTVA